MCKSMFYVYSNKTVYTLLACAVLEINHIFQFLLYNLIRVCEHNISRTNEAIPKIFGKLKCS